MRALLSKLCLVIVIALSVSSCATYFGPDSRRGVSSSLVDYLYPDGEVPPKYEETKPHLQLPLSVGLAFVPSKNHAYFTLPEAKKNLLLEEVKQKFVNLDYVREITVIPETYMRSSSGFKGMGQIARLYNLDVIALVSYDQVVVTSETKSALSYWTLVGAYLIEGNQNQATTFVDTAVFDVNSRKILFRAPGVSDIKQSSTLMEVGQANREVMDQGFTLAMTDMSNNLVKELMRFEERVQEDKSVTISHREGYGGGGSTGWPFLLLLAGLVAVRFAKK